jgi:hypothetical protein
VREAVLADKNRGAAIDVRLEARKRLLKDACALREGEGGPRRLRGLGGRDRLVDMRGCSAHDRPHELVRSRRISDLDSVGAVDRLAVDQHVFGERRFGVT